MPKSWPDWPDEQISLSWLSYTMFEECRRKWFNRYRYLAFDPGLARNLKAEGLLLPFSALAGKIVDDTLKDAFREYKERQTWTLDLIARSREILAEHLAQSQVWANSVLDPTTPVDRWPKVTQPIDRIYFREKIPRAEWQAVENKIESCLTNFIDSGVRDFFMEFHHKYWLCPKRKSKQGRAPVWFRHNGVPVYASFDFMINAPEQTLIVDWKTGKLDETSTKAMKQLHWYALYAIEALQVPPDRIRLLACWLSAGPVKFKDYVEPVQPSLLDEIREEIRGRLEFLDQFVRPYRMRERESLGFFPLVEWQKACQRCQFRSCEGRARLAP